MTMRNRHCPSCGERLPPDLAADFEPQSEGVEYERERAGLDRHMRETDALVNRNFNHEAGFEGEEEDDAPEGEDRGFLHYLVLRRAARMILGG